MTPGFLRSVVSTWAPKTFWAVFWAIIAVQITNVIIGFGVLTFLAAAAAAAARVAPTLDTVAAELAP